MIWADFITYVAGFLLASTMLILNRHEKIKVVILFFIAGGLLYAAMNAAYSVEEKFNPATDDCTEWKCSNEKFGFKLDIVSYGNYECSYIVPEPFRLRGSFSGWHNELTFNGTCVSWQPKKQEKVYVVEVNGTIVGNITEAELRKHGEYFDQTMIENKLREIASKYCRSNPSDSERCRCVKTREVLVRCETLGSTDYNPQTVCVEVVPR